jgi:hypothetical protein
MFNNFFFSENRAVYEMWKKKNGRARQAADENMIECRKAARLHKHNI